MLYKYEMHMHTRECSACAKSAAVDMVRTYHDAGYAGVALTDHFGLGNTAVPRSWPWEATVRRYWEVYLEAKALGDQLDFDVIFAVEYGYGNAMELLLYGIDLDFLLVNPNLTALDISEVVRRVRAYGGLSVHAHPYRKRGYIPEDAKPWLDGVDGIEVYNFNNSPADNDEALSAAERLGIRLRTSGSDCHLSTGRDMGMAGMAFPQRVRNGRELVAALKSGTGRLIKDGKIV